METGRKICFAAVLAAILTICVSCGGSEEYRTLEGGTWNTVYHITYRSEKPLDDSVRNLFREIGRSVSTFEKGSLIDRINSSDGGETDIHLRQVYEGSLRVNRLTGGAFDPTLEPLITAWGFGPGHTPTADTLRVDSLLRLVGIERTRLENGRLVKENPLTRFNFSGIAKGYGVDGIAAMLERNGVADYMVEVGGEVRCKGKSPRGDGWRIGIDSPESGGEPGKELEKVVELDGLSMATSGNYRNYHKEGTRSFGHTIDRATGRPARTDVLSATVISRECMEADALATAFMAMGSGKGKELAVSRRIPVMLVLEGHKVWESPEFKRLTNGKH